MAVADLMCFGRYQALSSTSSNRLRASKSSSAQAAGLAKQCAG